MISFQWLGASGFLIGIDQATILIDPFLSRNQRAWPKQPLRPEDLPSIDYIFLTHGHFDHSLDIPLLLKTHEAHLYCSETLRRYFVRRGVASTRVVAIKGGTRCLFERFQVRAFTTHHLRGSWKELIKAVLRMGWKIREIIPFLSRPCGEVLSYRFTSPSLSFHHFGCPGATEEELNNLSRFPLDTLLLPLQGDKRIWRHAFGYVAKLRPRYLIPHHHDDFYPPLSRRLDIDPFIKMVRIYFPNTEVKALSINQKAVF